MLQVAKSTRGASAVVTWKQVLEEEWLVVPSFSSTYVHRASAMDKHCVRELNPTASLCVMLQPPLCSKMF